MKKSLPSIPPITAFKNILLDFLKEYETIKYPAKTFITLKKQPIKILIIVMPEKF
jgi:hypothetical protein